MPSVDLDPSSAQPFDDSYEAGLYTVVQVQGELNPLGNDCLSIASRFLALSVF